MKILKINLIILLIMSFFCKNPLICEKTCKASEKAQLVEINQANFISDFYSNKNLLGEKGKNKKVVFKEDIDLSPEATGGAFLKSFEPIGTSEPFTACVDGCGKTIKNFNINFPASSDLAFFGTVSSKIENLNFDKAKVVAKQNASIFCVSLEGAIVRNITVTSSKLYAECCSNFATYIKNSFVLNISSTVDSVYTDCGFEFAKVIESTGLNEVSAKNTSEGYDVESNYRLENWSSDIEKGYQKARVALSIEVEKAEIQPNVMQSGKKSKVIFPILGLLGAYFVGTLTIIYKNFNLMLTKKH